MALPRAFRGPRPAQVRPASTPTRRSSCTWAPTSSPARRCWCPPTSRTRRSPGPSPSRRTPPAPRASGWSTPTPTYDAPPSRHAPEAALTSARPWELARLEEWAVHGPGLHQAHRQRRPARVRRHRPGPHRAGPARAGHAVPGDDAERAGAVDDRRGPQRRLGARRSSASRTWSGSGRRSRWRCGSTPAAPTTSSRSGGGTGTGSAPGRRP